MTKQTAISIALLLFSKLCIPGAIVAQEIIPTERRIEWNPGIPGGIPEIQSPLVNIVDHGADPSGVADSKNAILSAMNSLPPEGGVVFIPEGTFRIGSKLTIGNDGIVFRGTGVNSKLLSEANGDCFEVVAYLRGDWQSLPGGVNKDSLTLTVADASLFTPGEFAEIDQDNDSLLMYTDPDWIVSWAENSVGQLFEVESVDGNELTFKTPANFTYTLDLNPRIRPMGLVKHVGFENLYVEKMVAKDHTFSFKNAAYCWIREVESYHTRRTHVHQNTCLGNEIRDSYFHRSFSYGGGGAGYGVECGLHVTNCLVENNIFDSLRHAMIIQVGANGNVYGYNYSIHPVQGEGESDLNIGWIPPDISIHGHYPLMNLFEGNRVEEIGIGDYWGPAGPGNTYFRNRVYGDGIIYYDESHRQNLVGNVTTLIKDNWKKSLLKLEHGNKVGSIISWDPEIPDQDLPASLYLDSVPAFFGKHHWPTFGPDVEAGLKLPAHTRYEELNHQLVKVLSQSRQSGNVKIYPNPCKEIVQIECQGSPSIIQFMDTTGKILSTMSPKSKHDNHELIQYGFDMSPFSPGIYIIEVQEQGGVSQTFMIARQ